MLCPSRKGRPVSVPEGTTRVAMLKKGEADIAFALDGEDALNVKRDSRLQLVPSKRASIYWIEFADQWDPKSPWHDRRLRLAVNHALNRQAVNEVACLGYCPPAGVIVPRVMEFALQTAPTPYDPQKGKQLLAEAGYPSGIDAGDFVPTPPFVTAGEAVTNYLGAVGIRTKMRLMDRAASIASSRCPSTWSCSPRSWTTARCGAWGRGWPSTCSTRCT